MVPASGCHPGIQAATAEGKVMSIPPMLCPSCHRDFPDPVINAARSIHCPWCAAVFADLRLPAAVPDRAGSGIPPAEAIQKPRPSVTAVTPRQPDTSGPPASAVNVTLYFFMAESSGFRLKLSMQLHLASQKCQATSAVPNFGGDPMANMPARALALMDHTHIARNGPLQSARRGGIHSWAIVARLYEATTRRPVLLAGPGACRVHRVTFSGNTGDR
jgi:hypothetical protein